MHGSPAQLTARLTCRNLHLLALRISSYLSLKPDAVLKHWASAKIAKSRPSATGSGKDVELSGDDEVCKLIVAKFKELGGYDVSYADIAKRAWEVGRPGLATKVTPIWTCSCTPTNGLVASRSRTSSIRPSTASAHDE